MGCFYFDESIQERGGFIIGAAIYSPLDLTPAVFAATEAVGLRPGIDEFKSSALMSNDVKQIALRRALRELFHVHEVKIGVVVIPREERAALGHHALKALGKFLSANILAEEPHQIYLDNEIVVPADDAAHFVRKYPATLFVSQDSVKVGGIQLADLTAHYLGTMLLEELGIVTKVVPAGPASGYLPDMQVSIGFELWAAVRYSLFRSQTAMSEEISDIGFRLFNVKDYGLYIAPNCQAGIRQGALARFGQVYLGCIH